MDFDPHQSAGFMINMVARMFARRMAEELRPLGITPSYLPTIFTLSDVGSTTQGELARLAAIEQPTMVLTLRRMERDGIISRVQDETDRRRAIVRLTPRGQELVPHIQAIAERINRGAFLGLPGEASAQLITLLSQAARNLEMLPMSDPNHTQGWTSS